MILYQRDRDQWPLFRTKSAVALMEKADSFIAFVKGTQAASGPLLSPASVAGNSTPCRGARSTSVSAV